MRNELRISNDDADVTEIKTKNKSLRLWFDPLECSNRKGHRHTVWNALFCISQEPIASYSLVDVDERSENLRFLSSSLMLRNTHQICLAFLVYLSFVASQHIQCNFKLCAILLVFCTKLWTKESFRFMFFTSLRQTNGLLQLKQVTKIDPTNYFMLNLDL